MPLIPNPLYPENPCIPEYPLTPVAYPNAFQLFIPLPILNLFVSSSTPNSPSAKTGLAANHSAEVPRRI